MRERGLPNSIAKNHHISKGPFIRKYTNMIERVTWASLIATRLLMYVLVVCAYHAWPTECALVCTIAIPIIMFVTLCVNCKEKGVCGTVLVCTWILSIIALGDSTKTAKIYVVVGAILWFDWAWALGTGAGHHCYPQPSTLPPLEDGVALMTASWD